MALVKTLATAFEYLQPGSIYENEADWTSCGVYIKAVIFTEEHGDDATTQNAYRLILTIICICSIIALTFLATSILSDTRLQSHP